MKKSFSKSTLKENLERITNPSGLNESIAEDWYDATVIYTDPRTGEELTGKVVRIDNGKLRIDVGKRDFTGLGKRDGYVIASPSQVRKVDDQSEVNESGMDRDFLSKIIDQYVGQQLDHKGPESQAELQSLEVLRQKVIDGRQLSTNELHLIMKKMYPLVKDVVGDYDGQMN